MAFMQPVIYKGDVVVVESSMGSTCIEADVFGGSELAALEKNGGAFDDVHEGIREVLVAIVAPYHEGGEVSSVAVKRGRWIAYLSAPGYMDRTEAADFDTREEAESYLRETYGEEESEDES